MATLLCYGLSIFDVSLLHFCCIFGIFPYKINNSTVEVSELCYVLSTIVICVFCIFEIIYLYFDISGSIMYMSVSRSLKRHSYYVLGSFTAIVTLLLLSILEISSINYSRSHIKNYPG